MTSFSDAQPIYSADAQIVSNVNNASDESAHVVGKILGDVDFEDNSDDMLIRDSIGEATSNLSLIEKASGIVQL